jgi:hypothetical protein
MFKWCCKRLNLDFVSNNALVAYNNLMTELLRSRQQDIIILFFFLFVSCTNGKRTRLTPYCRPNKLSHTKYKHFKHNIVYLPSWPFIGATEYLRQIKTGFKKHKTSEISITENSHILAQYQKCHFTCKI